MTQNGSETDSEPIRKTCISFDEIFYQNELEWIELSRTDF